MASAPPSSSSLAPRCAAGTFTALGALHVLWATGSSWPAADAGTISGRSGASASPGPVACLRALDRRYYGPLCLGLAVLSAPAVAPARG